MSDSTVTEKPSFESVYLLTQRNAEAIQKLGEKLEAMAVREQESKAEAEKREAEAAKREEERRAEAEKREEERRAEAKKFEQELRAEAAKREAEAAKREAEAAKREAEAAKHEQERKAQAEKFEQELRAEAAKREAEAAKREAEAAKREAEAAKHEQERKAQAEKFEQELRAEAAKREAEAAKREQERKAQAEKFEQELRAEAAKREAEAAKREAEAAKRRQELEEKYQAEAAKRDAEAARQHQEFKAEVNKMIKESQRRINRLDELFTSQWGKLIEALVDGRVVEMFNEIGIKVDQTNQRSEGYYEGKKQEIDILAINGDEIVAIEVKTTLRPEDVKVFENKLKVLKFWMRQYSGEKVYGAVAYIRADGGSAELAAKRGLFLIKAVGDSAHLTNDEGFKPRTF